MCLSMLMLTISWVEAAGNSQNSHTDIYRQWKSGTFVQTLYLPNTYLPYTSRPMDRELACRPLPNSQTDLRRQYITLLTIMGVSCTGDWCGLDGNFSCADMGRQCYEVEHIIDKANTDPDLVGLNVNIVGNLVMAYGRWNQQVGQLSWNNVVTEKREIYTTFLFETARHYVLTCNGSDTSAITELDASNLIGLVLGGIVLSVMAVALCVVSRLKPKPRIIDVALPQEPEREAEDDAEGNTYQEGEGPEGPSPQI